MLIFVVAPYMGAWIEIVVPEIDAYHYSVAPYMGAWIEILPQYAHLLLKWSLPIWERGLKSLSTALSVSKLSRSLYGSVD